MSLIAPLEHMFARLLQQALSAMGISLLDSFIELFDNAPDKGNGPVIPVALTWEKREAMYREYFKIPTISEVDQNLYYFVPPNLTISSPKQMFLTPNLTFPRSKGYIPPGADNNNRPPDNSDPMQLYLYEESIVNVLKNIKFKFLEEGDEG